MFLVDRTNKRNGPTVRGISGGHRQRGPTRGMEGAEGRCPPPPRRTSSVRSSLRSKASTGRRPRMHLSLGHGGVYGQQPEQVERIFKALRKGLKYVLRATCYVLRHHFNLVLCLGYWDPSVNVTHRHVATTLPHTKTNKKHFLLTVGLSQTPPTARRKENAFVFVIV